MISRRNYFAAVMLMLVLMFLLMGSNVLRDYWNDFAANGHAQAQSGYSADINPIWYDDAGHSTTGSAVFIGPAASRSRAAVVEWASYSRREFSSFATLAAYEAASDSVRSPDMLILDAASLDWSSEKSASYLMDCAESGVRLIFGSLPDTDAIRNSFGLRDLLGIRGITAEDQTVDDVFLYSGFLLGGGKLYVWPDDPEEAEHTVFFGDTDAAGRPVCDWYQLASGTKVYMRGIPKDRVEERENNPPLIWRRSFGSSYVFAVNGSYLEGIEALGILSAMAADAYPYSIYPVVNAQNLVLIDYPVLSDENRQEMQRLYSRSAMDVYQELVWTKVRQATLQHGYKVSCMMTPQLDYSDDISPDDRQFEYYLKMFNEASAEAGLSLVGTPDISVEQKVEEDQLFFEGASDYLFSSVYSGSLPAAELSTALDSELLSSVVTAVQDFRTEERPLNLFSEDVTCQTTLDTDFTCTYKQDFQVRCLGTALGFTSIAYDMRRIAYPASKNDAWERLSHEFDASLYGYAQLLPALEKTTVSEASARIHALLTTKYTENLQGDVIHVQTAGGDGTSRFILRTNDSAVQQVDGGIFTELEEGAYLIEAEQDEIAVHLSMHDAGLRQDSKGVHS